MDPANYNGDRDASHQTNESELCEYLHFMACISNYIPRFAELAAPLYQLLEIAYKKVGRRTKKSIANLSFILLGWEERDYDALYGLQETLLT